MITPPQPTVIVVVSVDTEEDNWNRARDGVTVENIRALPRFARLARGWGARVTYFTAFRVTACDWAADVLRRIKADGAAEIGAHLHPWNTPPLVAADHADSMLCNLPYEAQLEKLQHLTTCHEATFLSAPRVFRAGRFGFGPSTMRALVECGYEIDSSVTPFVDWSSTDNGPDFVGAGLSPYRPSDSDVRSPSASGPIVEIPVSGGYTRGRPAEWLGLRHRLSSKPARALKVPGFLARLGIARSAMLSPEGRGLGDMLGLSRGIVQGGNRYLHLFLHSPTLVPGLTPFTSTLREVDRLLAHLETYLEHLSRRASLQFATVSEAAAILAPPFHVKVAD